MNQPAIKDLSSDSCCLCGTKFSNSEQPLAITRMASLRLNDVMRMAQSTYRDKPFTYVWEDKNEMLEGHEVGVLGKPGGVSGSIVLEGVRIPLGDRFVSIPCCAKCKKRADSTQSREAWGFWWALPIIAASVYFAWKFSLNSSGLTDMVIFFLLLFLFISIGVGGTYALITYLGNPDAELHVNGTSHLIAHVEREINSARQSAKLKEAEAALKARKKQAEATAKAKEREAKAKEREAEVTAKAKEREAEAAAKAKKEQEIFLQVVALYKKAVAATSTWRLDNPDEAQRLDEAAENKVRSAVDAEGGVFVGEGQFRFLETNPSVVEDYVKAEAKKLSEEEIITTLLSQWNLNLNSAQLTKVKQAAEEQQ